MANFNVTSLSRLKVILIAHMLFVQLSQSFQEPESSNQQELSKQEAPKASDTKRGEAKTPKQSQELAIDCYHKKLHNALWIIIGLQDKTDSRWFERNI